MNRREFIAGLGSAASFSLPLAVRAEQPALPVIGLLSSTPFEHLSGGLAAFRRGLAETGHVEGQNVAFEYRTAESHFDRLPALAEDLVRRRVAAIFTAVNLNPALAAKAASRVTPIVFVTGANPVRRGLVASLSRPGAARPSSFSTPGLGSCFGRKSTLSSHRRWHQETRSAASSAPLRPRRQSATQPRRAPQ
jgi:putative tryptophan/tyrosine transport system substrate-binding protein